MALFEWTATSQLVLRCSFGLASLAPGGPAKSWAPVRERVRAVRVPLGLTVAGRGRLRISGGGLSRIPLSLGVALDSDQGGWVTGLPGLVTCGPVA